MSGKWALLRDTLAVVADRLGDADQARLEIKQRLQWGELSSRCESYLDHWIFRSTNRKINNGYRAVPRGTRHMVRIEPDWWGICEMNFEKSTAHARWNASDGAKIGDEPPFKILIDGVLIATADVDKLWPVPTKKPKSIKLHPPSRAALDKVLMKEAKPELTQPDIKKAVEDHFRKLGKHVTDRLFRDAYQNLPASKKRAPGETNKTRKIRGA